MDFTLPDEHVRLKDAARKLFAERLPPERLAEIADAPDARDAVDAALWDEVVKLGWVGMATDLVGDFSYEAVLLEEAGYALAPIPMLSTTVAMPAAIAMADSGRETATVAWAEPGGAEAFGPAEQVRMPAIEHDRADRLGGRKVGVPDMQLVKKIVVLARDRRG